MTEDYVGILSSPTQDLIRAPSRADYPLCFGDGPLVLDSRLPPLFPDIADSHTWDSL